MNKNKKHWKSKRLTVFLFVAYPRLVVVAGFSATNLIGWLLLLLVSKLSRKVTE